MKEQNTAPIVTLGIDLAKRSFHLFGEEANGKPVLNTKVSRARLSRFVATLPACRIAMEACGSAAPTAMRYA